MTDTPSTETRLFGRDKRPLCMASYLLSLDWYRDNWMCHVFIAEEGPNAGRLMAWPHYRVLWGEAAPHLCCVWPCCEILHRACSGTRI